ncbi:MAG: PAS domain S-box protein, partial [Nitrospirae bacterium]|nr:PAS domain S-box protein [Nitrospirota bacterium]
MTKTPAPPDEGFHPLIEGTAAALFVFDADKALYINPACRQLTGKSAREILGQPFIELFHPRSRRAIQNNLQKGAAAHHQVELLQSGGETVWVDLRVQPIFFRGAMAMLATAFDITGYKKAEHDRRDREVQLKLVQRAGRTVSWEWRVQEDVLMISGLPKEILDSTAAPILATSSRTLFEAVHPEDLVLLKQEIRNSLSHGEPLFVEIRLRDPEGDIHWLVLRGQPISSVASHGPHLVGVATDISERRRAEEALYQDQEETLAVLASIADGLIR